MHNKTENVIALCLTTVIRSWITGVNENQDDWIEYWGWIKDVIPRWK